MLKRLIDWHLLRWKESSYRKPLLLRGARQVGKTYAVRKLGETFDSFMEINFELAENARNIFEGDLEPERILRDLSFYADKDIVPGKTLLFFDEIQEAPKAIIALRYFYEKMPELHVIAAGSLFDFAVEKVGLPVGRVSSLYMYPCSFIEFLAADGHQLLLQALLEDSKKRPFSEAIHQKLLQLVGEYAAIGGMPEALAKWIETKNPKESFQIYPNKLKNREFANAESPRFDFEKTSPLLDIGAVFSESKMGLSAKAKTDSSTCLGIHHDLISSCRQDLEKYATKHQEKYINTLFSRLPHFVGEQFQYKNIPGEFRKRELMPCLDLLVKANVIHRIYHSAGNGIPLGAEVNLDWFKIMLVDIGLCQALLGFDLATWFLQPGIEFINRGAIAEAFVGQELLCYSHPSRKTDLYFWKRASRNSSAEVDFLFEHNQQVIPIEVKSGHGSRLTSMNLFLEEHKNSPYGIRFSAQNSSLFEKIDSRPLYDVVSLAHIDQKEALSSLV